MKAALLLAVLAQAVPPSRAQPAARGANAASEASSLESHLALPVAERLLASGNSDDRVRGVDRLAASGQREAVDRLVHALEPTSPIWRDLRARIAALRALAPYASREPVRQALTKGLSSEPGRLPLSQFAQETAAMALAASEDPRALDVLVSAVRQGGSPAAAATQGILAYPPKSLVAFGATHDGLAAPLCQLVARLHDVRGIGLLRATLARGFAAGSAAEGEPPAEDQSKRARIAAALALAELGDEEQLPVARAWLTGTDAELRIAGAEVLVRSGAAEAETAVAALMRAPEARAPAIRLAASIPRPSLLGPLAEAAAGYDPPARIALAALGRMDAPLGIEKLAAIARDPAHALDAAFALARAPGTDARRAIEAMLAEPGRRRLAARAGVVRALALGDEPRGLGSALAALLASSEAADRAAAAYGRVVLRLDDGSKLVRSGDAWEARAVARASLVLPRELGPACVARLASEKDDTTRAALGIALAVDPEAWELLSTSQLLAWADTDDPLAPLSALALGERERDGEKSAARRLLGSADPVVRAHAARGLARSPLPDATGRLADALRFEPDESVRRAIVIALSARREAQRIGALETVIRFDPGARVRELARLALRSPIPAPLAQAGAACRRESAGACHVAWISLVPSSPAARPLVENRAARWLDASGLSLPIVVDPDGSALVAGVSPGSATFRLASGPFWYDAREHDAVEAEPAR